MAVPKNTPSTPRWRPSQGNALANANIYAGNRQAEGYDKANVAAKDSYYTGRADVQNYQQKLNNLYNPGIRLGAQSLHDMHGGKYDMSDYQDNVGVMGPEYNPNAGPAVQYQNQVGQWQGFNSDQLEDDPSYQWRMQQQMQAVERSAAAGSGAVTGATLTALQRQSGQMASQEFAAARQRALQDYQVRHQTGMQDHQLRSQAQQIQHQQTLQDSQNQQQIHQANFARQAQGYALENQKVQAQAAVQQFVAQIGQASKEGLSGATQQFAGLNQANTMANLQASMTNIIGKYDALGQAAIGAENAIYKKWEAMENLKLGHSTLAAQMRGQDKSVFSSLIGGISGVLGSLSK